MVLLIGILKKHKTFVISIITCVFIISISLFLLIFNSKGFKANRELKQISKQLNNINISLSDSIDDLSIDTSKASSNLSDGLTSLRELSSKLIDIDATSVNNSEIKDALSTSVDSTINLYDTSLNLLATPNSVTSNDVLTNFDNLKNECINNYEALSKKNINVRFSNSTLNFFSNYYNYLNTLVKVNRDSQFKTSLEREFIYKIDGFKNDFNYLNEDLTPAINKVKEDNRDLVVIIDDIYKKETLYQDLEDTLSKISIPEGNMDSYEALKEYINSYKPYLVAIKEAVILDKTNGNEEEDISRKYKEASSKRDNVLVAFEAFNKKLNNN
ncbi:hypothetical protein [Clostridium tertium]|uniref:Uncharacterized protein n=1 Tax=Clostridium tertium TaxID=1559 RepID=A0A6N3CPY2_9CLOT